MVIRLSSRNNKEREVELKHSETRIKVPKEKVEALKGVVGGKTLSRMKKEYVECPLDMTTKSFVECFTCGDFVRRIKGKVYCTKQ